MKRRFLIFSLYIVPLILGFLFIQFSQIRATYSGICHLIEDRYYNHDDRFQKWIHLCHVFALSIEPFRDPGEVLTDFQNLMDRLGSSHFQIYDLEQDQKMWHGMAVDSGLSVTNTLEGVLVVRVVSGSPAELAKFRAGDIILKINENEHFKVREATNTSGVYTVLRNGGILKLNLKIERYQVDGPPRLTAIGAIGALEISSFRSEYFERESWKKTIHEFGKFKHLVIDLRQNSGGNFASMLRALSPFFCEPQRIGVLDIPRASAQEKKPLRFEDVLEDEVQLAELENTSSLELHTFSDYGPCFRGRVDVLISSNTSSVSEIFAYALKQHYGARLFGERTAGEVVLAVWYALPQLGAPYTISIPRALFVGEEGEVLEGNGVSPDVILAEDQMWHSVSEVIPKILKAGFR